jgi:integrase
MRTRFHIEKRRDASGKLLSFDRPVLMSVTYQGNRVILGTGVKVDIHGWDADLQRVQSSYPGAQHLNNRLQTMQDTADRTMTALQDSDTVPDPESFRRLFRQFKPKYSSGFFHLFYEFMESNSSTWSHATYRKIRTLYKLLREYGDQSAVPLSFQSMDKQFLDSFLSFFREKGYQYSTAYKSVNNLVWFLNWASNKGYNMYHEYRKFYKYMEAPLSQARLPLYLHWDELMHLKELLTENRRKERVRDLFLFMCYTGIRFSELQRVKKEDVDQESIHIRKPGGGVRVVPMNRHAREIHQRYEQKYYLNNIAFPPMSIVTMNKYLRLIGKEAGLRRLVYSDIYEHGIPLYKRLTAAVAIHTFIKNAVELEIPVEVISRITGVQKDSRIQRIKSELTDIEMSKFNTELSP